jgi:hypothetical protein
MITGYCEDVGDAEDAATLELEAPLYTFGFSMEGSDLMLQNVACRVRE